MVWRFFSPRDLLNINVKVYIVSKIVTRLILFNVMPNEKKEKSIGQGKSH